MRKEENVFGDRKEFDPKANVLEYSCERVLNHYASSYQKTLDETKAVWQRLMKFFENFKTSTQKSFDDQEADELYHVFLIYTKEYRQFCMKYFGAYIDHIP